LHEVRPHYSAIIIGETFIDWQSRRSFHLVEKTRLHSSLVFLDLFAPHR